MLKVTDATVNWYVGCVNDPQLRLTIPGAIAAMNDENLRYERKGSLYYAENGGMVSFFYYSRPDEGFGGRHFPIVLKDGTEKILKGPWSSRAGVMNAAGFGPCVDVSFYDPDNTFPELTYGGAISLDLAQEGAKIAGVTLVYKEHRDDVIYEIAEPKPEKIRN